MMAYAIKRLNKMRGYLLIVALVIALSSLLIGCGGGGDAGGETGSGGTETGDAARGEALYKQTAIGAASAPGCITCHSLEEGMTLVGPSHAGIAVRAATAVSGVSAEGFLRKSITDPDDVVTENFSPGVMYKNYDTDLSEQEIADLVAFLLTQK
jgi:cytochrome c2